MNRRFSRWLLPLLLGLALLAPVPAWAGPVSWVEVQPTSEGRQWWDEGSLRRNRAGNLTVLSRYQAALQPVTEAAGPSKGRTAAPAGSLPPSVDQASPASERAAPPISRLYVMELDCDQSLYRDISVNGLPQFGATWQPTGSDDLTAEVLRQACAAEAA